MIVTTGLNMTDKERKESVRQRIKHSKQSLSPAFTGIAEVIVNCPEKIMTMINEFNQLLSLSLNDIAILKAIDKTGKGKLKFSSFWNMINAIKIIEKAMGKLFYKTHIEEKCMHFVEIGCARRKGLTKSKTKNWDRELFRRKK